MIPSFAAALHGSELWTNSEDNGEWNLPTQMWKQQISSGSESKPNNMAANLHRSRFTVKFGFLCEHRTSWTGVVGNTSTPCYLHFCSLVSPHSFAQAITAISKTAEPKVKWRICTLFLHDAALFYWDFTFYPSQNCGFANKNLKSVKYICIQFLIQYFLQPHLAVNTTGSFYSFANQESRGFFPFFFVKWLKLRLIEGGEHHLLLRSMILKSCHQFSTQSWS